MAAVAATAPYQQHITVVVVVVVVVVEIKPSFSSGIPLPSAPIRGWAKFRSRSIIMEVLES
jgi:hypothetical protein